MYALLLHMSWMYRVMCLQIGNILLHATGEMHHIARILKLSSIPQNCFYTNAHADREEKNV